MGIIRLRIAEQYRGHYAGWDIAGNTVCVIGAAAILFRQCAI